MPKERRVFLQETLELWQPKAGKKLSLQDAHECVENIAGFYDVLREWEEKAKARREDIAGQPMRENTGRISGGAAQEKARKKPSAATRETSEKTEEKAA